MDFRDVTFVSGLWLVDGNPKRSADHYFAHLSDTLQMIRGGNLLFFHNDERIKAVVSEEAERNQIALHCVDWPIEELPAYDQADAMIRRFSPEECTWLKVKGEKAFSHYWRDLKRGGPQCLGHMTSIWMSKVPLVWEFVISENLFKDELFCWVDASIAMMKNQRTNWDFRWLTLTPDCISHYGSKMMYRGRQLPLSAGFLFGGERRMV